jgi:hypothetical protein
MTPPAAAAAPTVRPRRAPAPRRVSGPLRPAAAPRVTAPGYAARRSAQAGLILGLLSGLESLAQHRLLDRLIRGRVWIGLVAFALLGIVTLQLGLLKLNGGIGRALEHEALLQRENAALSIENSELAAGTRVEAGAAKLGMAFVPVSALRFLSAGGHDDAGKAAAALASAAHAAAQAREVSAAEASAAEAEPSVTGETGEGGSSSEAAGASEGGEGTAEASSSTGTGEESSAGDVGSSGESSGSEAAPEATAAAGGEAEASGGSAASTSGG